jgi:hypothetical protein
MGVRKDSFGFGMLRKREVVLPSLRGLLILLSAASAAAVFLAARVQPFLAVNHPIGGEVLVMEGWIPDYAMREALQVFRSHPYKLLITTGGPLPEGMVFSSYGTHAQFAAVALAGMGLPADSLAAVPSPDVGRDRTYQEGVSLREWMRANGKHFARVDVVSFSAHARRSRLLYRMALGKATEVGVYAPRDAGYDPAGWWKTSDGFRRVTDEVIAYLYAKIWFRP